MSKCYSVDTCMYVIVVYSLMQANRGINTIEHETPFQVENGTCEVFGCYHVQPSFTKAFRGAVCASKSGTTN